MLPTSEAASSTEVNSFLNKTNDCKSSQEFIHSHTLSGILYHTHQLTLKSFQTPWEKLAGLWNKCKEEKKHNTSHFFTRCPLLVLFHNVSTYSTPLNPGSSHWPVCVSAIGCVCMPECMGCQSLPGCLQFHPEHYDCFSLALGERRWCPFPHIKHLSLKQIFSYWFESMMSSLLSPWLFSTESVFPLSDYCSRLFVLLDTHTHVPTTKL